MRRANGTKSVAGNSCRRSVSKRGAKEEEGGREKGCFREEREVTVSDLRRERAGEQQAKRVERREREYTSTRAKDAYTRHSRGREDAKEQKVTPSDSSENQMVATHTQGTHRLPSPADPTQTHETIACAFHDDDLPFFSFSCSCSSRHPILPFSPSSCLHLPTLTRLASRTPSSLCLDPVHRPVLATSGSGDDSSQVSIPNT